MAQGPLKKLVLTANLGRLIRLEGCLSGNVPAQGLRQLPPVCSQLARAKPARVVFGPGTFLNLAATQISGGFQQRLQANKQQSDVLAKQAAEASKRRGDPPAVQKRLGAQARQLAQTQLQQQLLGLGLRYGLLSVPSVDNPDFVSKVVFDPRARNEQPKARFGYLFPSRNAALIQVRLKPGLTDTQRREAIDLIKQATSEKVFQAQPDPGQKPEFRYVVSGVPVVAEGLATAVQNAIVVLLIAALLVMAATLAFVFRTRLRLLPLALALAAAALTFGGLSLSGGSLTMASIAVLPVLIGLAVDYAIQFQARFDEERSRRRDGPEAAASRAAAAGGPTIFTAGLATGVGFLVLLLSPVPMVRGFGALLVLGIVLALGCAITAGFAALVARDEAEEQPDVPPVLPRLRRALSRFGKRVSTSRPSLAVLRRWDTVRDRIADRAERALAFSMAKPRKVLGIGLIVAVIGLAVDTQSEVISDVQQLVPQDLQALQDVNELQKETGIAGEIDVTVRADDVTDPAVLSWMRRFQDKVLEKGGYKRAQRDSCLDKRNPPDLCPAFSLTDLFQSDQPLQKDQITGLLDAVPTYFQQGAITRDRKTANLAFGIRLQPLDKQREVVDEIKEELNPPAGRGGQRGRAAGAGSRGQRGAVLAAAAAVHARRRAAGGVPGAVGRAPLAPGRLRAADPDRAGHRVVGRDAVRAGDAARPAGGGPQPDVGDPRRAGDRDLDRVQRAAVLALPPGTGEGRGARACAGAHLRVDRSGGAGVGSHGHRGLRRADPVRHHDAARLRDRDRGRPERVADRGAAGAARRAAVGRGARADHAARLRPPASWRATLWAGRPHVRRPRIPRPRMRRPSFRLPRLRRRRGSRA